MLRERCSSSACTCRRKRKYHICKWNQGFPPPPQLSPVFQSEPLISLATHSLWQSSNRKFSDAGIIDILCQKKQEREGFDTVLNPLPLGDPIRVPQTDANCTVGRRHVPLGTRTIRINNKKNRNNQSNQSNDKRE